MKKIILILALVLFSVLLYVSIMAGGDTRHLAEINTIVRAEIADGNIPGAVVMVGQSDEILYHRAFGYASIEPHRQEMTPQTGFDLASLTKAVATAPAILQLVSQGQLSLEDRVSVYLPAYGCAGKEDTRIKHLLTHTSGLPAYTSAQALEEQGGAECPDLVIQTICELQALNQPGEVLRYSCLGYIVAAHIVEIVSKKSVADFSRECIFQPLGMSHTTYNPLSFFVGEIAGTEISDGPLYQGQVHDPLARCMGGISGNAGLFSTALDLSRYCRMLLNKGTWQGKRILSSEAVSLLTTEQTQGRACGFDVNSSYAWIKGSHAGASAFCHSGYTGTSIVCDPVRKRYVIILTNRVHPRDDGSCRALRTAIADIVFQPGGK